MDMHRIAVAIVALGLAGCANLPSAAEQARRNEANFARVAEGMSQDEVVGLFGRPDETMPHPLARATSWGYVAHDTWGYLTEFSVTFGADGRVRSKYARRINDGGDHQ